MSYRLIYADGSTGKTYLTIPAAVADIEKQFPNMVFSAAQMNGERITRFWASNAQFEAKDPYFAYLIPLTKRETFLFWEGHNEASL